MIEYYKHIKRLQHRSVSLKHLKFRDRDIELLELSQVGKKKKRTCWISALSSSTSFMNNWYRTNRWAALHRLWVKLSFAYSMVFEMIKVWVLDEDIASNFRDFFSFLLLFIYFENERPVFKLNLFLHIEVISSYWSYFFTFASSPSPSQFHCFYNLRARDGIFEGRRWNFLTHLSGGQT